MRNVAINDDNLKSQSWIIGIVLFVLGIIFGLTLNWTKLSSGYLVAYGVAVILPLVNAIAVTISSKVRTYCKKTSLRVVGLAGLLYLVCLLFLWIFKREWHFRRSSWL